MDPANRQTAQGRNRDLIAQQPDLFDSVDLMEATRAAPRHVDFTAMSQEATAQSMLAADDGPHPLGVMYSEQANIQLPATY